MYEDAKKIMEVIIYLKDLHIEFLVALNKKLVDNEHMKAKFVEFIAETTDTTNYHDSKVPELIAIDGVLKWASDKLQAKVAKLTKRHDYWVIRVDNIYVPGAKELKVVLDATKAHKAKSVLPKKKNWLLRGVIF